MVTHRTTNVAGVQCPAKCLDGLVAGVDDTKDMAHDDVTSGEPFLNRKVLDVDMTGASSRTSLVHHSDSSLIVHIERGGPELSEAKFVQNGAKILGNLGSTHRGNEFRFRQAGGH